MGKFTTIGADGKVEDFDSLEDLIAQDGERFDQFAGSVKVAAKGLNSAVNSEYGRIKSLVKKFEGDLKSITNKIAALPLGRFDRDVNQKLDYFIRVAEALSSKAAKELKF